MEGSHQLALHLRRGRAGAALPWFLWSGTRAAVASIMLGSIAALAVGGALGFLGGRNLAWSAARQLFVLAIAAGATWAVGRLFNVTVS